jgi:hypothetical protein
MGHRRSVFAFATTVVIAAAVLMAPADAQELAAAGGFFRAVWSVPPLPRSLTKIEGYIYNDSRLCVTDVRLRIVSLDGAGHAVGETSGWVFGDIPAGSRAYFAVPLTEPASTYGVTVISFDVVSDSSE